VLKGEKRMLDSQKKQWKGSQGVLPAQNIVGEEVPKKILCCKMHYLNISSDLKIMLQIATYLQHIIC